MKNLRNVNLLEKAIEGRLSRRDTLAAMAGAGLALVARPVRRATAATGEIDYITWAGYEEPVFWQDFIDKHGALVNYTFQGDEEEALTKVRAGFQADLMHPCTFISGKYRDAGIIRPIDVSRLSRWNDVIPELRTTHGVVIDGDVVFLPFDWLTSSVVYRTDLVDPAYGEEETWQLLFDERYKGKIGMYGGESGVVVAAMTLGIENVWSMTDDELAQCKELLERQSELLRFYFIDPSNMEQAIRSGEIVAAYGWNFSYLSLKADGIPVGYMQAPREGPIAWICGIAWTNVGDADEALVYDFLDSMLSPEAGRYLIDEWGVGHSNAESFALASEEAIENAFGSDPMDLLRRSTVASPMSGELHERYVRLIEGVKLEAGL